MGRLFRASAFELGGAPTHSLLRRITAVTRSLWCEYCYLTSRLLLSLNTTLAMKSTVSLLPLLLCVLLPSCAAIQKREEVKKAEANVSEQQEVQLYEWANPGINGKATVRINLSEQKAHILDDGKEVAWTYVATGVEGRRTPSGRYSITEKIADKHSNTWGVIVNADGETINWDGHSGHSYIPKGGRFVGCPHAPLDAPDQLRYRHARRPHP